MVRRAALAVAALLLTLVAAPAWAQGTWIGREHAGRTFEAMVELFRQHYWDPTYVDWDAWAAEHRDSVLGAGTRVEFDRALSRMVRELGDDHSSWSGQPGDGLPPVHEADPGLADDPPPRLGVQYSFVAGRGLVVERVFPSTAAAAAGLRRGDVIVAVDGTPLADRGSLFDANGVLLEALERGAARLSVERRRERLTLEVAPRPVAFREVASLPYAQMLDATTGYLAVPTFNVGGIGAGAHDGLRELAAAGAVGLVLDLRGNLGGRLVELGLLMGAFIDGDWAEAVSRDEIAWVARFESGDGRGTARLVTPGGEVLAEAQVDDPVRWRGPVVVVVGSENASAGEIAALALQDHGAARVVGEPTAGNVEAVRGFTLPDGSRVLIAVANLRGVNGLDFDAGVVPDVLARTTVLDLSRGVDPAIAEARRLLGALPFTPDRYF